MSTLKVDGIRSNGDTSGNDAITLADNGTCRANITNNLSNRNLIINGAMQVAQRGSASSSTQGLATVDRFKKIGSGCGNTFSQEQITLTSGDAYDAGFRKAFRVSQDQAGTANAAGAIDFSHYIEAQNLAGSGWNYTSASSKITLQFWFRASTNQTFYGVLYTPDGTVQSYPFSFTASGNNAWTKITHTIPGNSNITINNDNGTGLIVYLIPFYGTNYTDNSKSVNTWSAHSTNYCPDMASTWLTAGASTFDVTGMQLEVSDYATNFEHKSYGQELALCQRYFYMHASGGFDLVNTDRCPIGLGYGYTSTAGFVLITFPTLMRTDPTLYKVVGTDYFNFAYNNNNGYPNDISANRMSSQVAELSFHTGSSWDQNAAGMFRTYNTAARVGFSAEL